jgi:hypothetical protein
MDAVTSDDLLDRLGLLRGLYAIWRNTWERFGMEPPAWSYRLYVRRYHKAFERYVRACVKGGEAPQIITCEPTRSGVFGVETSMASGRGAIQR